MIMRFRAWWSLVVVLVVAVGVGGACIFYTNHTQQRADQRWCDLMTTLDQPSPAPTTARGREIQRQIHELRRDLDCEGR